MQKEVLFRLENGTPITMEKVNTKFGVLTLPTISLKLSKELVKAINEDGSVTISGRDLGRLARLEQLNVASRALYEIKKGLQEKVKFNKEELVTKKGEDIETETGESCFPILGISEQAQLNIHRDFVPLVHGFEVALDCEI